MISIYDIESYPNLFTCTFKEIKNGELRSFVAFGERNEWAAFKAYFLEHEGLIGYNNVDYDYRVLHPFLTADYEGISGDYMARLIYQRSQEVITEGFDEKREIPLVPQRDLFRVWHFNNKARMVSLKYLQFNMGWRNMSESPFEWTHEFKTQEEVDLVIEYNVNDVNSTYEFYNRSKERIRLRAGLGKLYDTNMGNFSDNKIGETIFLKELAKRTGRSEKSIASGRTPRKNIPVRDCLVPGINFETPGFKDILKQYEKKIITKTKLTAAEKKKQKMFAYLDGVKYEFGMGGLHALRAPGIYKNLRTSDVSSYYPNLAIGQKLYPHHLGPVFCEVYNTIYKMKEEAKKESDEKTAYKAALVCVFGSSNAQWSPFYDPKYTMSITINGQLLLAMLCERITTSGAGHIIMANTDGIETQVLDENLFKQICAEWCENFHFVLEHNTYKQLAVRDVNAYHAIDITNKVKTKGDFEIKKEIWKDSSMRIIPVAVDAYFRQGIPVARTIEQCEDISLFLIGKRAKTGKLEYRYTKDGELVKQKLPKNVRYFISRNGGAIVKVTKATEKQQKKKKTDITENHISMFVVATKKKTGEVTRVTTIHQGYRMTLFNQWIEKPFAEYNVEKQFYIREANKLIDSVIKNQTNIL